MNFNKFCLINQPICRRMQHRTDQNELKDLDIDEKAIEEIKVLKKNSNKVLGISSILHYR